MCMAAIGLIGAGVQAIGAMQQANAQSAEYKAKAAYNKRQAQVERIKGVYEAGRVKERGERVYSSQRATLGEAGVTLDSGTAADVVSDSVSQNELDVQAVLWGQTLAGQNYDYQAKIDKMNAKSSKQAGVWGALTPLINSFSSLQGAYST